ncbi:hypothetical protein [Bradyrhizobium sp. 149]|uniref:hypothetical protein n=1 Tax=Bradyrhizobium sp. 149 TaxID=2782624 RepID=UPI001FFA2757|nr:hypothetical protein [Bradyrhizobium sp. 149]
MNALSSYSPGGRFWAHLTRLDHGALPSRGAIGEGGITNGFYGMSLRALDCFSGTCTADSAELEGIALAGKRSLRFAASLKLMRRS